MQRTKLILAAVCIFAVAFGGGAATHAQLSDTETARVSAAAGAFDLCAAGETVTYEFSRSSDTLVNVNGPDIFTFSNYDYSSFLGSPGAVDAVNFVSTEPIRSAQFRSRFGRTSTRTFNPPATQARLDLGGSFFDAFVSVTFTCAAGDGTQRAAAPRPASLSEPSNSSTDEAEPSTTVEATSKASTLTTEGGTGTSENASSDQTATTSVTKPIEDTTSTPVTPPPTERRTRTTTATFTTTETSNTVSTETTTETQTETVESTEATNLTDTSEAPTSTTAPSPTKTSVATSDSIAEEVGK